MSAANPQSEVVTLRAPEIPPRPPGMSDTQRLACLAAMRDGVSRVAAALDAEIEGLVRVLSAQEGRAEVAKRRTACAIAMRRGGMTYRDIAAALGVSVPRVHRIVREGGGDL